MTASKRLPFHKEGAGHMGRKGGGMEREETEGRQEGRMEREREREERMEGWRRWERAQRGNDVIP